MVKLGVAKLLMVVLGLAFDAYGEDIGENQIVLKFGNEPLPLSEWIAAGYFDVATDSEALKTDYLKFADERMVSGFTLKQALAAPGSGAKFRVIRRVEMAENVNPFVVFSLKKSKGIAPTFYLEAAVQADRASDAILLLGSDGLVSAWLNGKDLGVPLKRREFLAESYNIQVPLRLAEGVNRFLFKVVRSEKSCGIVATLVPDAHQAVGMLFRNNRSFIRSLILPEGSPLVLELRGAPSGSAISISVEEANRTNIASFEMSDSGTRWRVPDSIRPGLYYASATAEGHTRSEAFVVGDPGAIIADAVAKLEMEGGARDAIDIRAISRRASILLDAKNRKPGDREWQRKVVYTIEELMEATTRIRNQLPMTKDLPGMHIRGFRAALDGAERHYRIFIPSKYDARHPIPLAIIAPTALSASRPFIESAFIASQLDAEYFAEVAEEFGIGLLWPGYPALPFGNPCEFSHLDEVLRAVAADYAIDNRRLYLLGTCQGAMIATMMAEYWPKRFAALGVLNPIVARQRNYPRDERKFQRFDAYTEWIGANAPIDHLKDVDGMPIHVVFDHGDPEHGTRVEAEDFVAAARSAKLSATFELVASSLSRINGWRQLLRSLSLEACKNASVELSARRSQLERRTGPVARGFSPVFAVVQGTVGSKSENVENARIVRQLADSWRSIFYAECPVELDVNVDVTSLRNRNFVLVGNAQTNAIWKSCAQSIALRMEGGEIIVDDKKYSGSRLGVQAIIRSPYNSERRCILIGAEDMASAQYGIMDLAIDGWFDYAIWRTESDGSVILVDAERYRDG